MVQIPPNFGCTRFKQSYERKHPHQNSRPSVCMFEWFPRKVAHDSRKNG